jgi:hypothetical protein
MEDKGKVVHLNSPPNAAVERRSRRVGPSFLRRFPVSACSLSSRPFLPVGDGKASSHPLGLIFVGRRRRRRASDRYARLSTSLPDVRNPKTRTSGVNLDLTMASFFFANNYPVCICTPMSPMLWVRPRWHGCCSIFQLA